MIINPFREESMMKIVSFISVMVILMAGSLFAGSLIGVSPSNAIEGGSATLTIEAEDTALTGETVLAVNLVKGELAIEAGSFTTLSDTLIEAEFDLSGNPDRGLWSIEVDLQSGTLTLEDCFKIYDPDINGDGFVDIDDFSLYAKHFLEVMAGYTLVPDLVSLSQSAAEQDILDAGLVLGTVEEVYSDTVDAGLVISQNPASGVLMLSGAIVNLVVSKGQEPVIVPDLSSLSQTEAENAITAAELSVGAITEQYSPTVAAGLVISQSPVAGESVAPGSAVDLVVSLGILDGGDPTAASWEEVNERWVKNIYADGAITMTDRTTNLMWLYDASMLGTSTWGGAKDLCNNLTYAGYSDWFLPDKDQLVAMYSQKAVFSNVQDTGEYPDTAYWSSTPVAGYHNSAYVDMSTGYVYIGSVVSSNNRGSIFWVWGCRSIE
jgi:hypothetical protein